MKHNYCPIIKASSLTKFMKNILLDFEQKNCDIELRTLVCAGRKMNELSSTTSLNFLLGKCSESQSGRVINNKTQQTW